MITPRFKPLSLSLGKSFRKRQSCASSKNGKEEEVKEEEEEEEKEKSLAIFQLRINSAERL